MHTLPIDDQFDVAFVNALARQEMYNKHLYRPNSYLHKWWARRCGTTFRAILKHLVEDETRRDYYTPRGLEGKVILDPMIGGGTTLHEAIRLGANVIGADIDPIPILQARATLRETDLPALIAAFEQFHQTLVAQLGDQYHTHCPTCQHEAPFRFILYGQQRHCDCSHPVVLVDSLTLRRFKDGSRIHIDPHTRIVYHNDAPLTDGVPHLHPLVERTHKRCATCGTKYREQRDVAWHCRLEPFAIFGKCDQHGEFFKPFDQRDCERLHSADIGRSALFNAADFEITPAPKSQSLLSRDIANYLDLFSTRQLRLLHAAQDALQAVGPMAKLNFALLLSTALEFNSLLCGYKGWHQQRPGSIRQTFVRHAYSLPYTVLENNPLFGHKRSGTLHKLFHSRIVRGRQWASAPQERNGIGWKRIDERDGGCEATTMADLKRSGQQFMLRHGSSAELDLPDNCVDFVVTDPPYYDTVQYGDLARFFTVWLRQLLPDAAQWEYALADSAVNQHDNNSQFETTLTQIFSECRRVLKPNGRLIFTFHHWKPEAWAALTIALKTARFQLINHYVVQAESPKSIHTANQRALLHDVVLVCGADIISQPAPQPSIFDLNDSYLFCDYCGALMRHLLHNSAENAQIRTLWQTALEKNGAAAS